MVFTTACLFVLGETCSGGRLLGSSSCSVGVSVVMFGSMVLRDGEVLPWCLLPGLAGWGPGLCALWRLRGIRAGVS